MPDDQKKYFVFIGGRDYHPDGPHFSPVRGQPYIVVTLRLTFTGWSAVGGEVRFDVPNSEIRPDVITSSTTDLERDLKGFLGNNVNSEEIESIRKAIYSALVNLIIDTAKKAHETEVTSATH